MSQNDDFLGNVTVKKTVEAGSRCQVTAKDLQPYLDFHKLSTTKDPITVEVKQMGWGTNDISEDQHFVAQVVLVDNDDAGIDGKEMFVSLGILV